MNTETELEVNEKTRHEDKVVHLQMIQGVIDRMSTSAAIYKGFAATIVTGIAAISFTEVSAWILLIAFLPVICFLMMDTYYLKLEKQYRILYEKSIWMFYVPIIAIGVVIVSLKFVGVI